MLARFALVVILGSLAFTASPEPAAGAERRCFERTITRHKTSLGIHQWTAQQEVRWCARGSRIVSVQRRGYHRTGTNWRYISGGGRVERRGPSLSVAETRFHFRLRYPNLEQNCRPRLILAMHASGASGAEIVTGC